MQLVAGSVTREQAMEDLQIGKTRLYELKASYLAARASGVGDEWVPGLFGGDHAEPWPDEEQRFLWRVLSPCGEAKRYSYAFADGRFCPTERANGTKVWLERHLAKEGLAYRVHQCILEAGGQVHRTVHARDP